MAVISLDVRVQWMQDQFMSKPLDVKPLNVKLQDVRPLDVRPLDVVPLDIKALDVKALDVTPLAPVLRRPISAQPWDKFNLGFFFLCSKAFSRIIFCLIFQSFHSSTCRQKELKLKCFLSFKILIQISH